ncbi:outer membrane protein assembly factor BamE domain-containing protein [Herbaspirillum sp. CF444]|uniref:outer membrane protein assembly factor BamE domain-containing protein n=1 Tax=Herbaspirillum sp. CF444 TaxID=1144319 RepID=UPI0012FB0D91|nr:outer membrane protein assembly factor BamE [Herbaspirillum sp. CF444]
MKNIICYMALLTLIGCQAIAYGTAEDFNKLSVGMSKEQVVQVLGTPSSTSANGDIGEETLVYRRMPNVVSWGPSNYVAVFKGGKLVRYGSPDLIKQP